ncbi:di-heme-cytochrome C peroxidase [Atopomonas sediminilitoris]|uniref:di-heme-cytochrome C peroxidase n=1 Tax=Atopomonas sediminilitoris TaxID=2919919 RepID=UPI001F4DE988|nr:di-heme-cytochrome C peroxidase [Atopomonas sediminilitoris]MCJ8167760.1 di-heme-cytochrome C peroxidase [Atopomonas sediminilitoris]
MRLVLRLLLLVLLLAGTAIAVVVHYLKNPHVPAYQAPEQVLYLNQWDEAARQLYYYTPQGTTLKGLRYDWLVALEQPFNQKRFIAPENLGRYGLLFDPKQTPSDANPGNLPVGLARHQDADTGQWYVDITCAACHTGELRYQGQAVRIDGGAGMHALASTVPTLKGGSFGQALGAAMALTYYNPSKFDRFADKVLGINAKRDRKKLRFEFKAVLDRFTATALNDWRRGLYPTEEGPGRTDAFGRIANTVYGDMIDEKNYHIANGPVNYPHLWDIWKFDWVQWNGSAMQPMARNVGEALGVGASLTLFNNNGQPVAINERYASSVRIHDMYRIEETLKTLKPPRWPEELFGAINLKQASKGRALFEENCAYCHAPRPQPQAKRLAPERDPEWKLKVIPTRIIGTDPTAADNIADNRYDVRRLGWTRGQLAGQDVTLVGDGTLADVDLAEVSSAKGLAYLTAYVEDRAYKNAGIRGDERARMDGFGLKIGVRELRGYKARPLDGIWATPPFLHNGSVPNLFQLLSPVAEREIKFHIGNLAFDPKHVGFETQEFPGSFLLDTSVTGNSNRGHEFRDGCRQGGVIGRYLSPSERWALIEYLKVLGHAELEQQLTPVPAKPWTEGPSCDALIPLVEAQ